MAKAPAFSTRPKTAIVLRLLRGEALDAVARELGRPAALAHSFGSHIPGAFFAHLLGPPSHPGPGMQMAYEWGKRHSDMPVLLIGQLPEEVFHALEAAGLVATQPVPGVPDDYQVPPETVFYAASYSVVNQHVQWQIVDPYSTRREQGLL